MKQNHCDECGSVHDLVLIDKKCDLWWCQDCIDEMDEDQRMWEQFGETP